MVHKAAINPYELKELIRWKLLRFMTAAVAYSPQADDVIMQSTLNNQDEHNLRIHPKIDLEKILDASLEKLRKRERSKNQEC